MGVVWYFFLINLLLSSKMSSHSKYAITIENEFTFPCTYFVLLIPLVRSKSYGVLLLSIRFEYFHAPSEASNITRCPAYNLVVGTISSNGGTGSHVIEGGLHLPHHGVDPRPFLCCHRFSFPYADTLGALVVDHIVHTYYVLTGSVSLRRVCDSPFFALRDHEEASVLHSSEEIEAQSV